MDFDKMSQENKENTVGEKFCLKYQQKLCFYELEYGVADRHIRVEMRSQIRA